MEDESIQKDEEKLKSLLETLKKNDENVPEELLKTKYKKPYRELKDSIKEVADQISGRRIRQDIVIKNDDAGQVLIKQIQEMLEEKRRAGTGKELGRTLYKEYSVEKFLQVVEEIRIAVWNLWIPYWQQHCCLYAAPECFDEDGPPPKIYNDLTKEFLVDQEQNWHTQTMDQRNTQISRPCRRQPPRYLRRRHQYEHDGTAVPDERASQSQEAAQRKSAVVLYHSLGQMRRAGETLY